MVKVPGDVKVLIVSPGLDVVSTVPPVAEKGIVGAPPPPPFFLPNPKELVPTLETKGAIIMQKLYKDL
jgi:hypothetical protein